MITPTLTVVFEEQVRKTPDTIALVCNDALLSFVAINEVANRIARLLIRLGVGAEDVVALALPRSSMTVIVILAVLKTGASYIPLDISDPPRRVALILEDARPLCILTTVEAAAQVPDTKRHLIALDSKDVIAELAHLKTANLRDEDRIRPCSAENSAYMIYTSGSTGAPKGVVINHRSVLNLLAAVKAVVKFTECDVGALFHSTTSDFSVWEMWAPLLCGSRLVIVPFITSRSPAELIELIGRYGITILGQTPSAFNLLLTVDDENGDVAAHSPLRIVAIGGEPLESKRLRHWFSNNSKRTMLLNFYGPTEVTIWASVHIVKSEDIVEGAKSTISIGCPLADYWIYVLDSDMRLVPPGVPGELYVAGLGLGRGYWLRPQLTAERFLPNPFNKGGSRLYRTGDLARWAADGRLEFICRTDDQIKFRGHRIEAGEIEAALLQQRGVLQSAAMLREDPSGKKDLVAYVVAKQKVTLSAGEIRRGLMAILPAHMLPSVITILDRWPLTSSGKLDRNALPTPGGSTQCDDLQLVGESSDTVGQIARIWEEVLGVEIRDPRANFFTIGGHSMSAVLVAAKLSKQNRRRVSASAIFKYPTMDELAAFLERDGKDSGI